MKRIFIIMLMFISGFSKAQTITYGSEYTKSTSSSTSTKTVDLGGGVYAGGYCTSSSLVLYVITKSGTTLSYGTSYSASITSGTSDLTLTAISSTKFVACYRKLSNNYAYARVLTISETTITSGSEYGVYTSGTISNPNCCYAGNNDVWFSYTKSSDTYNYSVVATISGTVLSFGSEALTFNNYYSTLTKGTLLSSDKLLISNGGRSGVLTVSGTTMSWGTTATNNFSNADFSICTLSSSYVFMQGSCIATVESTCCIISVSGTTVTHGSSYRYYYDSNQYKSATLPAVTPISSTQTVITYKETNGTTYGYAVVASVSGTSISYSQSYPFYSSATSYFSPLGTSSSDFLVMYEHDTSGQYGVVGTITSSGKKINGITISKWNGITPSKINGI